MTTVIIRLVVVEVSKFDVSDGVKVAVKEAEPSAAGVQEHVADVAAAAAAPQPDMVDPPNIKLTVPARETVAVITTAPPKAAFVADPGSEVEIEVAALLTVIVRVLVPTWLFPSVARTD